MNPIEVGQFIKVQRKRMNLTQKDLSEKLNISFQAVSKWENGQTLPDTTILPDLSDALEVSIDQILNAGAFRRSVNRMINVEAIQGTLQLYRKYQENLGAKHPITISVMNALSEAVGKDYQEAINDDRTREILVAKTILHRVAEGHYVNPEDVKAFFTDEDITKKVLLKLKQFDTQK